MRRALGDCYVQVYVLMLAVIPRSRLPDKDKYSCGVLGLIINKVITDDEMKTIGFFA